MKNEISTNKKKQNKTSSIGGEIIHSTSFLELGEGGIIMLCTHTKGIIVSFVLISKIFFLKNSFFFLKDVVITPLQCGFVPQVNLIKYQKLKTLKGSPRKDIFNHNRMKTADKFEYLYE